MRVSRIAVLALALTGAGVFTGCSTTPTDTGGALRGIGVERGESDGLSARMPAGAGIVYLDADAVQSPSQSTTAP